MEGVGQGMDWLDKGSIAQQYEQELVHANPIWIKESGDVGPAARLGSSLAARSVLAGGSQTLG